MLYGDKRNLFPFVLLAKTTCCVRVLSKHTYTKRPSEPDDCVMPNDIIVTWGVNTSEIQNMLFGIQCVPKHFILGCERIFPFDLFSSSFAMVHISYDIASDTLFGYYHFCSAVFVPVGCLFLFSFFFFCYFVSFLLRLFFAFNEIFCWHCDKRYEILYNIWQKSLHVLFPQLCKFFFPFLLSQKHRFRFFILRSKTRNKSEGEREENTRNKW